MKISEIGGEFAMLKKLAYLSKPTKDLLVGVGDDCALFKTAKNKHQLITTDMIVEDDHFSIHWQTPLQIGAKLIESNVSDIVCKGGTPRFAFLSMCLKKDTSYEWVEDFFKGIYKSCSKHQVILAGGDTTHGNLLVFNLALSGEINPGLFRKRSSAKPGDFICVTGQLGGSAAGLALLKAGVQGFLVDYLEPKSRTAYEGKLIATYANSTIDVSDGLASEVTHLATESHTGAVIYYEKIPLSANTIETGKKLNTDPANYALYGGEDFEILFTIAPKNISKLKKRFTDFTVVGEILSADKGIYLLKDGKPLALQKGYDHFA